MRLNSIMLVCQSTLRTVIMFLAYKLMLGLSTFLGRAVLGYAVGMTMGGLIGIALLWTQYKDLPKQHNAKLEIKAYTGLMLSYGIPLSLSVIISSFQTQFYLLLLPIFYLIDERAIGSYGIATTLLF